MIRSLILVSLASGLAASQTAPAPAPELVVSVKPLKDVYTVGEPIRVRYEIENVGETPFYMSKRIDPIGNALGCVSLKVGAEHGGEGIVETKNFDLSSDYWDNRDIQEEIRTNWLLLQPGQFYGMTATVGFTSLKAGHYSVVAEHASGQVSDKEKSLLTDLKFPLLLGTHSSKPARIKVIDRPRRKQKWHPALH